MKLSMVRRTIYGSRGGWTRRSLVLAAALTAAASPSIAGDVAITPVALFHAAPVPEALRPQAPFSMHVSPGDHVKVAFYERVAVLADGRAEQVSSSQLVERTELTGEYVVQLDGTVFVPCSEQSISDPSPYRKRGMLCHGLQKRNRPRRKDLAVSCLTRAGICHRCGVQSRYLYLQ